MVDMLQVRRLAFFAFEASSSTPKGRPREYQTRNPLLPGPDRLTMLPPCPISALCLGLLFVATLLAAAAAAAAAGAALILLLDGGQGKGVAHASGRGPPAAVVAALVPGQGADPGLDVVVQAQLDAVRLGDAGRGVGDLVLWALVLEGELAPVGGCAARPR